MVPTITQPLRQEHREQVPRIDACRLSALIRIHFTKEEIYRPLLDDRLSAEDAAQMLEAMDVAGRRAHGT